MYPVDQGTEDPRIVFYEGWYYNFAYGTNASQAKMDGCVGTQCTVVLARSQTPLDARSWQHISTYNWHRNGSSCTLQLLHPARPYPTKSFKVAPFLQTGCCIMRPVGQPSYCIYGEGPGPLPGLGIAMTTNINEGVFTDVNWTQGVFSNNSRWLLPLGEVYNEVRFQ